MKIERGGRNGAKVAFGCCLSTGSDQVSPDIDQRRGLEKNSARHVIAQLPLIASGRIGVQISPDFRTCAFSHPINKGIKASTEEIRSGEHLEEFRNALIPQLQPYSAQGAPYITLELTGGKMPDQRSLITLEELSAWFTERVQQHQECADCKVTIQYKLQQPDTNGCNWSDSVVFRAGPDTNKEAARAIIAQYMPEARKKFNVH